MFHPKANLDFIQGLPDSMSAHIGIEFLELGQIDKLYEVAEKNSPHYKLYIEFMLLTGCRIGELFNLKLGDFDNNVRYITFRGKSGERRFPVDELLIDCIKNIFVHHFTILDDKECNLLNDPDHNFLMNNRLLGSR